MKRFIILLLAGTIYPATPNKKLLDLLDQDSRIVMHVYSNDQKHKIPLENGEYQEFKEWVENKKRECNYFRAALLASTITTTAGMIITLAVIHFVNKS